jgi:hypothetical protein
MTTFPRPANHADLSAFAGVDAPRMGVGTLAPDRRFGYGRRDTELQPQ